MANRHIHRRSWSAARAPFFFTLTLFLAYGAAVGRFPALNFAPGVSVAGWFGGWSNAYPWVAVDGDTLTTPDGGRIRLLGVDTPELHPCRCPRECELGARARRRTQALLNEGALSVQATGRDWYGRTLARVSVGGRDLSSILIAEGLGRPPQREALAGKRHSVCEANAGGAS